MKVITRLIVRSVVLLGVVIPCFLSISGFAADRPAPPASPGPSTLSNALKEDVLSVSGKLRILRLEGTPYEMGLAHGRAMRKELREIVELWRKDLETTYKTDAASFIKALLAKTNFRPAIEKWTPGLLDEVRGIADGAGLDFETMYAYQLIDETWVAGPDLGLGKCTSIGAGKTAGRPAFVSQTLDIPAYYHGYQTVLRIRDREADLETLVLTIPGVVAANGLNSRGVGLCVNAVTQLVYTTDGLPVAFVIRGTLKKNSFMEAAEFLRTIKPAAPQNYLLGGPDGVASFELAGNRIARFVPFEGAAFTYHTNHPMVNEEFNPKFLERVKPRGWSVDRMKASCPRFNFLKHTLGDNSAALGLDDLKALYRDRKSGINNAGTYACTIMLLGDDPELHIAPGRPDTEPFQILPFSARPGSPSPRRGLPQ
ncbi:MAG: C45 family peptidase [Candidatus Aminicenantes bacterium]|nr:C45 family peptidase [Candidatus Aminicenantes bacterium]